MSKFTTFNDLVSNVGHLFRMPYMQANIAYYFFMFTNLMEKKVGFCFFVISLNTSLGDHMEQFSSLCFVVSIHMLKCQ